MTNLKSTLQNKTKQTRHAAMQHMVTAALFCAVLCVIAPITIPTPVGIGFTLGVLGIFWLVHFFLRFGRQVRQFAIWFWDVLVYRYFPDGTGVQMFCLVWQAGISWLLSPWQFCSLYPCKKNTCGKESLAWSLHCWCAMFLVPHGMSILLTPRGKQDFWYVCYRLFRLIYSKVPQHWGYGMPFQNGAHRCEKLHHNTKRIATQKFLPFRDFVT